MCYAGKMGWNTRCSPVELLKEKSFRLRIHNGEWNMDSIKATSLYTNTVLWPMEGWLRAHSGVQYGQHNIPYLESSHRQRIMTKNTHVVHLDPNHNSTCFVFRAIYWNVFWFPWIGSPLLVLGVLCISCLSLVHTIQHFLWSIWKGQVLGVLSVVPVPVS